VHLPTLDACIGNPPCSMPCSTCTIRPHPRSTVTHPRSSTTQSHHYSSIRSAGSSAQGRHGDRSSSCTPQECRGMPQRLSVLLSTLERPRQLP
jgi:hypothetical protein